MGALRADLYKGQRGVSAKAGGDSPLSPKRCSYEEKYLGGEFFPLL